MSPILIVVASSVDSEKIPFLLRDKYLPYMKRLGSYPNAMISLMDSTDFFINFLYMVVSIP